jgi:hypothetical protein
MQNLSNFRQHNTIAKQVGVPSCWSLDSLSYDRLPAEIILGSTEMLV